MKYSYNLDVFFNEDAESYYLLGAFMTDGTIRPNENNCILTSKDEDWLIAIKNKICPDLELKHGNGTKTVKNFTITSKELKQWFVSKNCTPNKSINLTLPKIPKKYFRDFLRGCFDGDGCIGMHIQNNSGYKKQLNYNVCCELTSASQKFITEISETILSLGFKNSIKTIKVGSRKPQKFNNRFIIQKK